MTFGSGTSMDWGKMVNEKPHFTLKRILFIKTPDL